jgi:hypothetical protein
MPEPRQETALAVWDAADHALVVSRIGARTATRYRKALGLLRQQRTDEELAAATGWALPHAQQVRSWWQAYEASGPQRRAVVALRRLLRRDPELRAELLDWHQRLKDYPVPSPGAFWVDDLSNRSSQITTDHPELYWSFEHGSVLIAVPAIDQSPRLTTARRGALTHICWPAYRSWQLQGGALLQSYADFLAQVQAEAVAVGASMGLSLVGTAGQATVIGLSPYFHQSAYKAALWMAKDPWMTDEHYATTSNPKGRGHHVRFGNQAIALVASRGQAREVISRHENLQEQLRTDIAVQAIHEQYRAVSAAQWEAAQAFWALAQP